MAEMLTTRRIRLVRVHTSSLYFTGRGTKYLNEIIECNKEMFTEALAYECELGGGWDIYGGRVRCREIAIRNFVSVEQLEELIVNCYDDLITSNQLERIFFQNVSSQYIRDLSVLINNNDNTVRSLAILMHDLLIKINGGNVSHFVILLNERIGGKINV